MKNTDFMEKGSSKSFLELNSPQKSQWTHMSIDPWWWSYEARKIDMVEICTKMANYVHFRTECCEKYLFYEKELQVKVA